MQTVSFLRLAACSLAFLGVFGACANDDEGSTPTPSAGAPTATDDDSGTDDPEGTVGALPIDFPENFPIYPTLVALRGSSQGERFTADWRTADAPDAVEDYYLEALDTPPWQTTDVDDSSVDAIVIDFENEEAGYSGQLGIGEITEGTRVLLNLEVDD